MEATPFMFGFEFQLVIDAYKDIACLTQTMHGSIPTVAEEGSSAIMLRGPYGVILDITP
jgi:hypothetical protein